MPVVHVKRPVEAPAGEVWRVVKDLERYAKFMENVRSITIVSESGDERLSDWSVLLKGSILEWREFERIDEPGMRIDFEQIDGDLETFDGFWSVTSVAATETLVELLVEFKIGIPLLEDMLNPVAERALADNSEAMLQAIEAQLP